jgi:hypothetical protein
MEASANRHTSAGSFSSKSAATPLLGSIVADGLPAPFEGGSTARTSVYVRNVSFLAGLNGRPDGLLAVGAQADRDVAVWVRPRWRSGRCRSRRAIWTDGFARTGQRAYSWFMPDMPNPSEQEESEQERLNRELDQLLNELRVAMPGVQVLFAFLLTVPFQQRFTQVTDFQRDVYFATLLAATAASALFIAPTAYHRLTFRARDKPALIRISSRLAVAGLVSLAAAMNGAVLLVTDVLFDSTTVTITVGVTGTLFVGLWFVLGLVRRMSGGHSQ